MIRKRHLIFLSISILLLFITSYASAAECGNGQCEEGENSCNCPDDCGRCAGDVAEKKCREYKCINAICTIVTKENCCGNKLCEGSGDYREDYGNCPADCEPTSVEIEIQSPKEEEKFFRGESVLLKVGITANDRPVIFPTINVKGVFAPLELFNDGEHEDEGWLDNIFANYFVIGKDANEGGSLLRIEASFRSAEGNSEINIIVDPRLETTVDLNEQYSLGDLIEISGEIKKRDKAVSIPLDINIVGDEKILFSKSIESDENGLFRTAYHSSLIDQVGEWLISIYGKDANNNYAFIEEIINITEPIEIKPLNIEFVKEFEEVYERGEEVQFIVRLLNESSELVGGANVIVITPIGEEVQLYELQLGKYSGSYNIGYDLPSGKQLFQVKATKRVDGATKEDFENVFVIIEEVKISLEVLAPDKFSYKMGEEIPLKLKLTYPDGRPVREAEAKALINEEEVSLESTEIGVYSGAYLAGEADYGEIKIFFQAVDSAGNSGLGEKEIEVSGTTIGYELQKYLPYIVAIFIVSILLALIGAGFLAKKARLANLRKRKEELESFEKAAQKKYFDEGSIGKKGYRELMDKYEKELKKVEGSIKELEKKKGK